MVQQNAGASEEMAATAGELSSQADQLQQAVAFFHVNGNGRSPTVDVPTKVKSIAGTRMASAEGEKKKRLTARPQ